jgi:hypothetical protein
MSDCMVYLGKQYPYTPDMEWGTRVEDGVRVVVNSLVVDMAIIGLAKNMPLRELSGLMTEVTPQLSMPHVLDRFRLHVRDLDVGMPMWERLASKPDYAKHMFNNRNWPVRKNANLTWQQIAQKLGRVKHIYQEQPGRPRQFVRVEDARNAREDEGELKVAEMAEKIKQLAGASQTRDVKLRRLRTRCNYGIYLVPTVVGEPEPVAAIWDVLRRFDMGLGIEYLLKLLISMKWFRLVVGTPILEQLVALCPDPTLVAYCMSYSMWLMLKEERMFGNSIAATSRAILTGDQWRCLPVFDYELQHQPYFVEIWGATRRNLLNENLLVHLSGERRQTSAEEFARRLSVMGAGVLDGVDMRPFGAYLTGSSLVPCIVTSPLEAGRTFEAFVDKFYPPYDSTARAAVAAARGDAPEDVPDFEVESAKEALAALEAIPMADFDIAVQALTMEEYDTKARALWAALRSNIERLDGRAPTGREFHMERFNTLTSYKYIFKGTRLRRPMDVFRTKFAGHQLTFGFHLNIVRSWWDGHELRMLASGACAALTGVNQWYRWFSSNKDPIQIVLKNMQRGYTTLLNEQERLLLLDYVNSVDGWAHLRGKIFLGQAAVDHPLFGNTGPSVEVAWKAEPSQWGKLNEGNRLVVPPVDKIGPWVVGLMRKN